MVILRQLITGHLLGKSRRAPYYMSSAYPDLSDIYFVAEPSGSCSIVGEDGRSIAVTIRVDQLYCLQASKEEKQWAKKEVGGHLVKGVDGDDAENRTKDFFCVRFHAGVHACIKINLEINIIIGGNVLPVMIVGPTKLPSGYSGTVTFKNILFFVKLKI